MNNPDYIKNLLGQQIAAKHPNLRNVRIRAGASVMDMALLRVGQEPSNKILPFFLARELGFSSWEELTQAALSVDA